MKNSTNIPQTLTEYLFLLSLCLMLFVPILLFTHHTLSIKLLLGVAISIAAGIAVRSAYEHWRNRRM